MYIDHDSLISDYCSNVSDKRSNNILPDIVRSVKTVQIRSSIIVILF